MWYNEAPGKKGKKRMRKLIAIDKYQLGQTYAKSQAKAEINCEVGEGGPEKGKAMVVIEH